MICNSEVLKSTWNEVYGAKCSRLMRLSLKGPQIILVALCNTNPCLLLKKVLKGHEIAAVMTIATLYMYIKIISQRYIFEMRLTS